MHGLGWDVRTRAMPPPNLRIYHHTNPGKIQIAMKTSCHRLLLQKLQPHKSLAVLGEPAVRYTPSSATEFADLLMPYGHT
jgi:hypothetical protein